MFPLVEDEGRTEYPFPPMPPTATDATEPSSSSSDTLPSASSRIGSRSSRASPAPRPNSPRDRDYAYDREQSWAGTGGKAKLLARLMTRSERDANHYRSMFMVANERLEHETRRADDAEQRAIDTLQRLRQARDQIAQAQADVARANEETRLWKLRLDEAQKEILRAQEVLDRLEQDKLDAEVEAARARTLARKLREEKVIARAMEEGRRQGFQEGLSRGREMSYYETRAAGITSRNEPRRYAQRPAVVDDMSDEEEEQEENATGSGSQPEEIIPITRSPPPQTWRPSSRAEETRPTMRSPPGQPTSPIRVRSPRIAAPSPVHPNVPPPATAPNPRSIPEPSAGRSQSRHDGHISPIPIHNAVPSPSHPPVDIPPDNWIPYMSSDNVIELPPPHEMTKPLTPRASSPSLIDSTMRVPANYEQSVRAHDYAYTAGAGPSQGQPPHASHGSAFSPLSKASTTISQYEIVSSRGDQGRSASHSRSRSDVLAGLREMISSPSGRSKTPSRQSREDRPIQSPRGPRPKEEPMTEVYNAAHPETFTRAQTPARSKTPARPETPGRSGTLDKLFKKRWRNRTSTSSGVPDIQVESPSTKQVSPVTSAGTVSQPHMLSPEASHADLPSLEVMQSYIAPELMGSRDKRDLPPLLGANPAGPDGVPILQEGQLPPGFIPFTPSTRQPVIPPSSRSNTPYTPIYAERDQSSSSRTDSTRTRTTSSSRRSAGSGTPKPATPKPRSGPTYEEAPLPPGVVYPAPPGRGPTPGAAAGVPSPQSPSRSTTPGRRKGSLSAALSPLSIPQLLSPLRMPS